MPSVNVHDFRICDRVLAETEPDAADVVYLGGGDVASPFVVIRKISGPGGVYVDAVDIIDADGASLGVWEKQYEVDGESKPRQIVTELRGVRFSGPGTYTLQYSIYDDVVGNFPFTAVRESSPSAGIVPGPLDAALNKSTIAWVTVGEPKPDKKIPRYADGKSHPVWYGYQDGRVYVLVGPGEQDVPGILDAGLVKLHARSKDKRSLVDEVDCGVEVLPKGAEWDAIARDLLIGRRLNLRDGDAAVDRWKKDCEIVILTPLPARATV